ncbi:hypothetical protein [Desulfotomaculum copahuensis]|uniref:Uncharacterized protein n=1 Tax=Desulfotomaculum copahuensis TaxID=1838280 RepID=A0A1B7LFD7_9FIRM|nr:hypothetical protein [Desulfotomaculum copahuensis]OAT82375.1 hypothetical protein A6M21_09550 [Desulfotomaculum copahuensis]
MNLVPEWRQIFTVIIVKRQRLTGTGRIALKSNPAVAAGPVYLLTELEPVLNEKFLDTVALSLYTG